MFSSFLFDQLQFVIIFCQGTLCSTEQGEMIQAKFGLPQVAVRQLEIYTTAVLLATMHPPQPPPEEKWRNLMEEI